MTNLMQLFDGSEWVSKSKPVGGVIVADNELVCPICYPDGYEGCGVSNLHHRRVISYMRNEDAKITEVVESGIDDEFHGTCTSAQHLIPSNEDNNPSPRRSGIAIDFYCEQCHAGERGLQLVIYQHKGSTYIEWRTKSLHGV